MINRLQRPTGLEETSIFYLLKPGSIDALRQYASAQCTSLLKAYFAMLSISKSSRSTLSAIANSFAIAIG